MEKITSLTPEQDRAIPEFRDEWLRIGVATGEADLDRVRPVIEDFYRQIGQAPPRFFIRCPSPFWAQIAIHILRCGGQLRDQLCAQLYTQLCAQLGDQLGGQLRDQLRGQLSGQLIQSADTWFWGSGESPWLAYYLFFERHLKEDIYTPELSALLHQWETISKNCFWWYPFKDICFVCDRPAAIRFDAQGRLHCADDMAVKFGDGWGVYCWHGVRVLEHVVVHPETITVPEIENCENVEVRRVLIERYGQERYLIDSGAREIQHDEFGILYRKNIADDEPLVMVKVTNSTPELDGAYKDYFIRVPPTMHTAHEAVAWTFGMTPEQYSPKFES